MKYSTPEKRGISTESIKKYLAHLERAGLSTHSLIIARGDDIVLEKYWKPFNRDFLHRMYSVSKSFVALAVGFLVQEGRMSLDDPICKFFPDECAKAYDDNIRKQTIRQMMMMSSALPKGYPNWMKTAAEDRVLDYFTNNRGSQYPAGSIFTYDSTGSFVVGAAVERVTGKRCMDYLYEKMLSKIGVEGAYALSCPGGWSWMDSAVMMRPIDLCRCARFVLNGGSWCGEQILDADYLREATSALVCNNDYGFGSLDCEGYGYLFWRTRYNSFFFNGMGCQLAVCCPERDLILVYNGDNQGNPVAKSVIIDGFFDIIYENVKDEPLPEYVGEPIAESELFALKGKASAPILERVNGTRFLLDDNPMGISEFTLRFGSDEGEFEYVNKTGKKILPFGILKNVFSKFPEEGYSLDVGAMVAPGNKYDCAASAAFANDYQLAMRVQIIDKYFGNLGIIFGFVGDEVGIKMTKCAENFLDTYGGYAKGKKA